MNQKTFVKEAIRGNMNGEGGQLNFDAAVDAVTQGLLTGTCPHGDEIVRTDERKARSYAKAVINNALKKDKEFNGGVKYTPAAPRGPRSDSQLRKLDKAVSDLELAGADAEMIAAVKASVEERKAQIAAENAESGVKTLDEIKAELAKLGVAV